MELSVEQFGPEIAEAVKTFDKHVVCLDKTPDDCQAALTRLVEKAIRAYENRSAGLRHGIALDKQVTIILSQSQNEGDAPLCAIYFNLSSPYHKQPTPRKAEAGSSKAGA